MDTSTAGMLWDDPEDVSARPSVSAPPLITDAQRARIRDLFEALGVSTSQEQFAIVREVTGQSIRRVPELTEANAQVLIYSLPSRILTRQQPKTGNAWDDREADTWIDRL